MLLLIFAFKILFFTISEIRKLIRSKKLCQRIFLYLLFGNFNFLCRYAAFASRLKYRSSDEPVIANYTYYALLKYLLAKQNKLNEEKLSATEKISLLKTDYLLGVIFVVCANQHDHIAYSKIKVLTQYIEAKAMDKGKDYFYLLDDECINCLQNNSVPVSAITAHELNTADMES